MSITYPPELLPKASADDEVEILVSDGFGGWVAVNANQENQPRTAYRGFGSIQSPKPH
jgi:hypothetical protein